MQTLEKRFNGNAKEVLKHIETFGYFSACSQYHTTYTSLKKWAGERTKNENFGVKPTLGSSYQDPFERLAETIIQKISKDNERIRTLERENAMLRLELERQGKGWELPAMSIMEACKV